MAPNGNIYYNEGYYDEDISKASIDRQALFIHEMAHVWQYQNGVDVFEEGMFDDNNYNYLPLKEGKTFAQYGIEQQGDIIRDYFYLSNGIERSNMPPIAVYRDLIPFVN